MLTQSLCRVGCSDAPQEVRLTAVSREQLGSPNRLEMERSQLHKNCSALPKRFSERLLNGLSQKTLRTKSHIVMTQPPQLYANGEMHVPHINAGSA